MSATSIEPRFCIFLLVAIVSWPSRVACVSSATENNLPDILEDNRHNAEGGFESFSVGHQEKNLWFTGACDQYTSCVHLIPHSHMDPLWRKSFKNYYEQSVVFIVHEIIVSLLQKQTRTFVFGDIQYLRAFLQERSHLNFFVGITPEDQRFFEIEMIRRNQTKWKNLANMTWLQVVRNLIQTGQLDIVGGGIVQHDEALTSPLEAFEQTSSGLQYLQSTLGVSPKISWQIDSFGHSTSTPDVLIANGFKYAILNRIGLNRKSRLKRGQCLEFKWKSTRLHRSSAIEDENAIIAHVLYDHYSFPDGFDEKEIIAREAVARRKAAQRQKERTRACTKADAHRLLRVVLTRMGVYRTKHIMIMMGDDFRFRHARTWFSFMECVIELMGTIRSDVLVRFSTATNYFSQFSSEHTKMLPEISGSFFPYYDRWWDNYWTGFYGSRPVLKSRIRSAAISNRIVQRAYKMGKEINEEMQSNSFALQLQSIESLVEGLAWQVGDMFHHDTITGTLSSSLVAACLDSTDKVAFMERKIMQNLAKVILHCGQGLNISSTNRKIVVFNPSVTERQAWIPITISDVCMKPRHSIPYQLVNSGIQNTNQSELYIVKKMAPLEMLVETVDIVNCNDKELRSENHQRASPTRVKLEIGEKYSLTDTVSVILPEDRSQGLWLHLEYPEKGLEEDYNFQIRQYHTAQGEVFGSGPYIMRSFLSAIGPAVFGIVFGMMTGLLLAAFTLDGTKTAKARRGSTSAKANKNPLVRLYGIRHAAILSFFSSVGVLQGSIFMHGMVFNPRVISDEFLHYLLDFGLSTTVVPSISIMYIFTLASESVAQIISFAISDKTRVFRIDSGPLSSLKMLNRTNSGQEYVGEKRKFVSSRRRELTRQLILVGMGVMLMSFTGTVTLLLFSTPFEHARLRMDILPFMNPVVDKGPLFSQAVITLNRNPYEYIAFRAPVNLDTKSPNSHDNKIEVIVRTGVKLNREAVLRVRSMNSQSTPEFMVFSGLSVETFAYRRFTTPPANFYPITVLTCTTPETRQKKTGFCVSPAQPLGMMPSPYGMDILLHRNVSQDDQKGLREPLIDNQIAKISLSLFPFALNRTKIYQFSTLLQQPPSSYLLEDRTSCDQQRYTPRDQSPLVRDLTKIDCFIENTWDPSCVH